jgi:hypothetical protein
MNLPKFRVVVHQLVSFFLWELFSHGQMKGHNSTNNE